MKLQLLKKGAEAYLYLDEWFGLKVVKKVRVVKSYRVGLLDEQLRKFRTAHEAKLLSSAKSFGVPTPVVFDVDVCKFTIVMEFIEGLLLKKLLPEVSDSERIRLCRLVGRNIGLLHSNGIFHGDLTTSNMIVQRDKIYFIDFGLGGFSKEIEYFGVDLHLLLRVLESSHHEIAEECFSAIVDGYSSVFDKADLVLKKVKEIRMRGRYVVERRAARRR